MAGLILEPRPLNFKKYHAVSQGQDQGIIGDAKVVKPESLINLSDDQNHIRVDPGSKGTESSLSLDSDPADKEQKS